MFYEVWHNFRLKSVSIKVTEDGPVVIRRVRIKVDRAFDEEIAEALGPDAVRVREGLATHGIEKATLPIDVIVCEGSLKAPAGTANIPRMHGMRAVGTAPKSDEPDDPNGDPIIQLEFDFPFSEDVWVFLGRNVGAWAEIKLVKAQLSLIDGGESAVS